MTKREIDWERVAQAYINGPDPVKEIAVKHGLATVNIYTRAKHEGWKRSHPDCAGLRAGSAGAASAKKLKRRSQRRGGVNSAQALKRMMGIINRLADELEQHLDAPDDSVTSSTEKKAAADILTSLARALEKLTALEREANGASAQGAMADARTEAEDGWEEVQRRLARLIGES